MYRVCLNMTSSHTYQHFLSRSWPHAVLMLCSMSEGSRHRYYYYQEVTGPQEVILQINLINNTISSCNVLTQGLLIYQNMHARTHACTHTPIILYILLHVGWALLLCQQKRRKSKKVKQIEPTLFFFWNNYLLCCIGSIHQQFSWVRKQAFERDRRLCLQKIKLEKCCIG